MRYDTLVFDTEGLLQDAPRGELEALGVACKAGAARAGALFVSADTAAVDAAYAQGLACRARPLEGRPCAPCPRYALPARAL